MQKIRPFTFSFFIITFNLILSLNLTSSQPLSSYSYIAGGDIEQPGDGFTLGASGAILSNKDSATKQESGEVRFSTGSPSSSLAVKAGSDFQRNQYGSLNLNYQEGSLAAEGQGDYFNGKTNGTGQVTLTSSSFSGDKKGQLGLGVAVSSEGQKEYNAWAKGTERFSYETEGSAELNSKGDFNLINGAASLNSTQGNLHLSGFGDAQYNRQQQQTSDWTYGAAAVLSPSPSLSLGAEASAHKSGAKEGQVFGQYQDSNFNNKGGISLKGNANYDLAASKQISKGAEGHLWQQLTNELKVQGNAFYSGSEGKPDQANADGQVDLDTQFATIGVKAQAKESYDLESSEVKNKTAFVELSKGFGENGNVKGRYDWVNGKTYGEAEGEATLQFEPANLKIEGAVKEDFQTEEKLGVFKGILDGISIGEFKTGVFGEASTKFDDLYNGNLGAFFENYWGTTKGEVKVNGEYSLRGSTFKRSSTVATFDHSFGSSSKLHLEAEKWNDSEANVEVNGWLETIVGDAKVKLFLKMDKNGKFSVSM